MDRIIFRESQARENTHCSLVGRGDHLILCRLTTDDLSSTFAGSTAVDQYQNVASLWSFDLGVQNWPVFTRLVRHSGGGGSELPAAGRVAAAPLPRLDWKVESISAGELIDKKTYVQRYSMTTFAEVREGGDLHFSSTGQLATVIYQSVSLSSEEGKTKYKLSLSLLLSTGVLGFGLTSWQDGYCSLYIPLMNIPQLQELEERSWKRVTRHPLLSSLARSVSQQAVL